MKRIAIAVVMLLSLTGTSPGVAAETQPPNSGDVSPATATAKVPAKAGKATHKRHVKATKQSKRATSAKTLAGRPAAALTPGSHPQPVVDHSTTYAGPPADLHGVQPVRSPQLKHVHPLPPPKRGDSNDGSHPEPIRPITPLQDGGPDQSTQQRAPGALISAPTATGLGFDGVGVGLAGFVPSSNPPDVNGRIGATQYVQWNNTSFAVFDKTTGALLYGPAAGNTLFQSLGGVCASHNDGDPVVSYDILAGRWILSQFAVGGPAGSFSHQCVAVSLTGDATGAYYLYDFLTDGTNFVDYPHIGVWPDGYYMSAHVFNAAGTSNVAARIYVFERDKMLLGQTARMQSKDLPKDGSGFQYGFLPADLDSLTPPPAGAQEYVIGPNAQFTNRTDISRVAVTWGVTPTMTLTSTTNSTVGVGTAPCISNTTGQDNRDCVPQPSPAVATDDLDNLGRHYMYRLAYRNNGGTESILATGVTPSTTVTTPAHGVIKWMEWRGASGSTAPTLFQSGNFDPTPTGTEYRWMPSIAMDKAGNIALGYSKSGPSTKPGIYMTGRLTGDTAGTMGAETTVQAGGGVQFSTGATGSAGNRWGDYSSMTIDPVDQCTFWYTNEYLKTNGSFNWSTRIASYKFPSCTPDTSWGTLTGTITSCATGVPLSGVIVNLSNGFAGTTDASGNYSIRVPNGTYTATASDSDRACSTGSPATVDVVVPANGSTSQNFCMTGASNIQFNALTIDDATNGNNNGIVNKNECVNLNVALKNNGCANESAVSATLSTSTSGVTVTQGSSSYPDMAIDVIGTNATPFKIQTSNTFVCGTTISLTLNVTYASGNKSIGISVPTCGGGANQSIPTSSIALTDPGQPDRMARDGVPSTCSGKACPGAINTAGTRNYKKFTFTNPAGVAACLTVQINASCGANDVESAAYLNNYTPPTAQGDTAGNLCLGYLGDSGISGLGSTVPASSYSITVPANSTFVVVVNTSTGGTTCGTFSGTVSGFYDLTAGPGACPGCVPPATPTASNTGPYCSGSTVSLSTPTVAGATYAWTGPNGFTSALQNPTRTNATTADAGTYSVTVTVAGCTSAAGTTNVVVNQTPATPTASNTGPYCVGGTVSLSTPAVAGATYSWTGPNGFTSALQNPTRSSATTADAGTYSVTVTVAGCTSAAGTTNVVVNQTPATPTASNTGPYCSGGTISLSTPAVAGATYSWTGPNGFTSALQNPTRSSATIADAGTYSVTVTVNGCSSAAGTTNVVVNATPATPTASNGGPYCSGGTISLSTPVVAGATYSWTGPNGFTSALQNPTRSSATTADAGTYSVTVTVNGCPSAAGTTNVVVNATPATPAPSNGGAYCEGATIALSTPTVAGATYAWTGPNGFISALQNPTRSSATVADAGTYSVTVTVSGCTSAAGTTNVVVNTIPATPTASNGGPYCAGSTLQLTTPTVAGATYAWTGPNGFTSALQNPTRASATTADAGTYSVTATVGGCTSATGSTNVVVNPSPATPTASNGGAYCAGATIALSTPAVAGATYAWTGPNGFTSALQNPTRPGSTTADGGVYSVTVTVSGCTSAAGTTNVVVNAIPATPAASNGGAYCAGATIALSTPAVGGATYAWTGPNGFTSALQNPTRSSATFADAGTYSVTVTVNGCTSAAGTTNVVVNATPATPTASNGGPYCAGATIALSTPAVGGATYAWTGPNGFTSALQNPTRASATTADSGTYSVTVTVSGCTSAAGTTNVVVNATPTPTATNGGPYCVGATVQLNASTVAGATYAWTGPNGFTSALQNPTRANSTTADAGTYSVTATVNGCTSAAGTTNVAVNAIPTTPTATNGGPYCAGATIQLNTSTVAGATYAWSGPNGFASALQNPTRASSTTADAGTYSVAIIINGCTSAAGTTNVVVNATAATPTATNGGPYCAGATIQLNTSTVAGATYAWTGPNGFTSALQNPTRSSATPVDAGTYSVTITVNGCTSPAGTTNVVVNAIPLTPTATNGGPYCAGSTIQLNTSTVAGATYAWTGPNGFASALQNPTRASSTTADAGTYSVTLTVNGCTSAAGTTNVVVNPIPATPTISAGSATTFCAGGSVTLTSSASTGNQWYVNGAPISGATSTTYVASSAGDYSVTATANSCPSAQSATTTVTVNPIPSATITVTSSMAAGASATASVADAGAGATYQWSIAGGTIDSGSGTRSINFTAGAAGTLTLNITVTRAGCADSKSANVTVTAAAPTVTVTAISPAHGPWIGGTPITVTGTGFQSGATLTIGGTAATSVVVVNATTITAKTPAHAPGTVDVTVTNPDTSHATLAGGFTVVPQQFDANGDNTIDSADIFYLVNFLFTGGPAPAGAAGMMSGDANGDGVVDSADIFYIVNYLFTGGPQPMSVQPRATITSTASISGSIFLGTPHFRGGRAFVPVIVTSDGPTAPDALSLQLHIDGAAGEATIHRVGGGSPVFEISREMPRGSAHDLSYIVSFDAAGGGMLQSAQSVTVAEIELAVQGRVNLSLDPVLSMLADGSGTHKATVAAGSLHLGSLNIDRRTPRAPSPRPDAQ